MIAGASISYWIAFHVLVAVLLVVDLGWSLWAGVAVGLRALFS